MTYNYDVYRQALEIVNKEIPYEDADYMNMCIANRFAYGKGDAATEDWIRRSLLQNVEDEFLTYGQALYLNPLYIKVVAKLKTMF